MPAKKSLKPRKAKVNQPPVNQTGTQPTAEDRATAQKNYEDLTEIWGLIYGAAQRVAAFLQREGFDLGFGPQASEGEGDSAIFQTLLLLYKAHQTIAVGTAEYEGEAIRLGVRHLPGERSTTPPTK